MARELCQILVAPATPHEFGNQFGKPRYVLKALDKLVALCPVKIASYADVVDARNLGGILDVIGGVVR